MSDVFTREESIQTDARSAPERERARPELDPFVRDGYKFDFFQLVHLLETLFSDAPAPGATSSYSAEKIRFRPDDAYVFPATDVKRVQRLDEDRVRVVLTFMGLYGVNSPVPAAFHRILARDGESSEIARDFLDIFNHRLYSLFYRAWKKYRPHLHGHGGKSNPYDGVFAGLAGMVSAPGNDENVPSALRLSAFAGHLGKSSRNSEGLQQMLQLFLEDISVYVEERVPRRVLIKQRPKLGRRTSDPMRLGLNAVIGSRVLDVAGKFRLHLGPMTLSQFRELSPGGSKAAMVHGLTQAYGTDYLDYDAKLTVNTGEIEPVRLGDRSFHLGRNAWLGRPGPQTMSQVVSYT